MNVWQASTLGIIQGLTEFFPISSSAHLILLRPVFSLGEESLLFDVILHGGTLFAVLIYLFPQYKKAIKNPLYILKVLLATIPAGAFGLIFEKTIEESIRQKYLLITLLLIAVGIIFILVREKRGKHLENPGFREALIIGLFQVFALFPGVSRSGATILAGLLVGLKREEAVIFSFFLSLTTIGGAFAKGVFQLSQGIFFNSPPLLAGFFSAFLTGLLACSLLFRIVQNRGLRPFGFYRIVVGILFLIWLAFRT
ncbi:MAG: undecaprenyl-diphosphate phosphatase [Candidatus Atribacteria bacterium]|nr:undecaprenyl-diphosphate phosphatase [Candidatus Atribacteria bacterium]MCD6349943.1 undecaprenyl-diphosphate phosphatase [Candidatus Atribacteria bacterium]